MFGGKKAKELEEELLALREKQNRLQEQISNIAKAKDSAGVFRGEFRTDRTVETAACKKE